MDFRVTPKGSDGSPIIAPTFEDTAGLSPHWESHLYTVAAGATNIFDELVTTERRLRGGWYELFDSNAVIGDYVEFAVVDKDDTLGLFSMYSLTVGEDVLELRKYVKTDYVKPADQNRQEFSGSSAFQITAGLYLRCIYVSTGINDVQFKVVTLCYE